MTTATGRHRTSMRKWQKRWSTDAYLLQFGDALGKLMADKSAESEIRKYVSVGKSELCKKMLVDFPLPADQLWSTLAFCRTAEQAMMRKVPVPPKIVTCSNDGWTRRMMSRFVVLDPRLQDPDYCAGVLAHRLQEAVVKAAERAVACRPDPSSYRDADREVMPADFSFLTFGRRSTLRVEPLGAGVVGPGAQNDAKAIAGDTSDVVHTAESDNEVDDCEFGDHSVHVDQFHPDAEEEDQVEEDESDVDDPDFEYDADDVYLDDEGGKSYV